MSNSGIAAVVDQRRLYAWCVVAALLCSCSGVPPEPDLSADSATTATAQDWLLRDCTFGSQGELAEEVRKKGDTLYKTFKNAYTKGPDSLTLCEWKEGAGRNYDAVIGLFSTTDTQRIPLRVRQQFQSTTKPDYVASVVAQCVISYKSNALLGLGLTRADSALPFINAVVADSKAGPTLHRSAELAKQIYADTSGQLLVY